MTPHATPVERTDLLLIEGLSKTFGGQRALDGVSLRIEEPEFRALVGQNGSGKSTLIKVLAGYHRPDPGARIEVGGVDLTSSVDAREVGLRFVHQDLGLVNELTAVENIAMESGFARRRGRLIDWRRQRDTAERLLARVGADLDVRRPVGELRPVDRSAVAIARALDETRYPIKLLVLDEPTAALPPSEVETLFEVLREVRASGVGIVYVSHRLDEILAAADSVSVLRDGVFQGTYPVRGMDRGGLIDHIVGPGNAAAAAETAAGTTTEIAAGSAAETGLRPAATPEITIAQLSTPGLSVHDIELRHGEILGVAGLTGSGREDFARALTGAIPARLTLTGSVAFAGTLSPSVAAGLGIALVLPNSEAASAVREFDVADNVGFASYLSMQRGGLLHQADLDRAAEHWIEELGIKPARPRALYANLSGGNRQKVVIARALMSDPRLVVFEEPTSGVDIGARRAIYGLFRQLADAGRSVVVCSSDLEDLVSATDRVLVLGDGEVVAEFPREGLTEHILNRSVLAGGRRASA